MREAGYDAVSIVIVDEGLSGATDERVRAHAITTVRVLVTLDGDFADILRFPPASTPGVIRLKIHPPTEETIREKLLRTLRALKGVSLEGRLAVSHGEIVRIRG